MVITKEIKERFQNCIGTTIIFCTNSEQVQILGKLYNGAAFRNLTTYKDDIEIYFKKDNDYGWVNGYCFEYFKSKSQWYCWKTITFNELMDINKVYELW